MISIFELLYNTFLGAKDYDKIIAEYETHKQKRQIIITENQNEIHELDRLIDEVRLDKEKQRKTKIGR